MVSLLLTVHGDGLSGLSAVTFGDPDAPQSASAFAPLFQPAEGCRPHLPTYPQFIAVGQSVVRPMLPANPQYSRCCTPMRPEDPQPMAAASSSFGLSSVPMRPSLGFPFRQNAAHGHCTAPCRSASASPSTFPRGRSRSPARPPPSRRTDASNSDSHRYDAFSDDALRAAMRRLLTDALQS